MKSWTLWKTKHLPIKLRSEIKAEVGDGVAFRNSHDKRQVELRHNGEWVALRFQQRPVLTPAPVNFNMHGFQRVPGCLWGSVSCSAQWVANPYSRVLLWRSDEAVNADSTECSANACWERNKYCPVFVLSSVCSGSLVVSLSLTYPSFVFHHLPRNPP